MSLQSCACACTHSWRRKSGRSGWKPEPGTHGYQWDGWLPWQRNATLVSASQHALEHSVTERHRTIFSLFLGMARLHCEASSPVKNLPIKHRTPQPGMEDGGVEHGVKDCWKRRKNLVSSSGTKRRSCENTPVSQAWQVRKFSLYCHLGAKNLPAPLPSHFNPSLEGTLAFYIQPAGVQLSSRSSAPAASRLSPIGHCSGPQWWDRHRGHSTCSKAQHLFSLHLCYFWKGLDQNHPVSAEWLFYRWNVLGWYQTGIGLTGTKLSREKKSIVKKHVSLFLVVPWTYQYHSYSLTISVVHISTVFFVFTVPSSALFPKQMAFNLSTLCLPFLSGLTKGRESFVTKRWFKVMFLDQQK